MFFAKTILVAAGCLLSSVNAQITGWDCSAGTVAYPNPNYCRQVYRCNAAGETAGWQQCRSVPGFLGMYSSTRRACVYTAFPDCATMHKYCPTLPTPLESDIQSNTLPPFGRKHSGDQEKTKRKYPKKGGNRGIIGPKRPIPKQALANANSTNIDVQSTFGKGIIGGSGIGSGIGDIGSSIGSAIGKIGKFEPKPSDDILPWGDCSVWSDGLYASNNCRYFMLCCGGRSQIMKCPFGTLFDDILLRCVESKKAVCYSIRS